MPTEPMTLEERVDHLWYALPTDAVMFYAREEQVKKILLAALEAAVAQERSALLKDFEAAIMGLRDAHHSGDIEQWEFAVDEAVATLAAARAEAPEKGVSE